MSATRLRNSAGASSGLAEPKLQADSCARSLKSLCCPSLSFRTTEDASPFVRGENVEMLFSDDIEVSCSRKLDGLFANADAINVSSAAGRLNMGNRNQNDDPCVNCKHFTISDVRHHRNSVILAHTSLSIGCPRYVQEGRESASSLRPRQPPLSRGGGGTTLNPKPETSKMNANCTYHTPRPPRFFCSGCEQQQFS